MSSFFSSAPIDLLDEIYDLYEVFPVRIKYIYFSAHCILIFSVNLIMQAIAAFQVALQYNPQSVEVSKRIKRLTDLTREKKRAEEVQNVGSSIDMGKYLDPLKTELVSL